MFDTVPVAWVAEYAQQRRAELANPRDDDSLRNADVDTHEPDPWATADKPSKPGSDIATHYVCGTDRHQLLLLVGPFRSEHAAATWVNTAQDLLLERGRVETALTVRVTRIISTSPLHRPGDLNRLIGVRTAF